MRQQYVATYDTTCTVIRQVKIDTACMAVMQLEHFFNSQSILEICWLLVLETAIGIHT